MRRILAVSLGLSLVAVIGCPGFGDEEGPITEVPDLPEWKRDMLPLLDKYCNECHSVPPTQSAPGYFRLDECEDSNISGAATMAERNKIRTADLKSMPPANYGFQPSETERQIFAQWFLSGAPCTGGGELPTNNATNNATNNSTNNTTNNSTNNATTNNTTNNTANNTAASFSAVAGILANGCGLSNCHGSGLGYGDLTLDIDDTPADVRAAIAGKNATSGIPFVVPGRPEDSRIYQVMSSQTMGVRMPPAGNLPDVSIEAVRSWIAAGASFQ